MAMKYELCHKSADILKKEIKTSVTVSISALAITFIINVLLIVFVTDETRTAFTLLNIFTDILVLSGTFAYLSLVIFEKRKIYLLLSNENIDEISNAVVCEIGSSETYEGFECVSLRVEKKRLLYLPTAIANDIKINNIINARLSGNIITGWEVGDE